MTALQALAQKYRLRLVCRSGIYGARHEAHLKRTKMNKERRKQIAEAAALFEKAYGMIDDVKSMLQNALDGEQEYFDNMPESLQGGEKGQMAEAAISALESAIEAMEGLDDVQGYIDEAGA